MHTHRLTSPHIYAHMVTHLFSRHGHITTQPIHKLQAYKPTSPMHTDPSLRPQALWQPKLLMHLPTSMLALTLVPPLV